MASVTSKTKLQSGEGRVIIVEASLALGLRALLRHRSGPVHQCFESRRSSQCTVLADRVGVHPDHLRATFAARLLITGTGDELWVHRPRVNGRVVPGKVHQLVLADGACPTISLLQRRRQRRHSQPSLAGAGNHIPSPTSDGYVSRPSDCRRHLQDFKHNIDIYKLRF